MDSEILQTMASEALEMEGGDMFQDVASGSGTSTTSSEAVLLTAHHRCPLPFKTTGRSFSVTRSGSPRPVSRAG